MLKTTQQNDQLHFLQNELAEQLLDFCTFLNALMKELTTKPGPAGDSALVISALPELVAQLIEEIERTGKTIRQQQPELADTTVRNFQFLLAAWADEVMIKMLGQERLPLAQHGGIERAIFGTVHAGNEVFEKIKRMLERRTMDDICLAAAYWLILVQGFEGRYIGGVNSTDLSRYTSGLQAIALKKIITTDIPKPKKVDEPHIQQPLFIRIGLLVRPKILLTFCIGLLLLCLISLELHWSSSTMQLTKNIPLMIDLRDRSSDLKDMKDMKDMK